MTLIEQISKDFMTAYKAKEMSKKDFLGVLKTEVTKESKTPDDGYVIGKINSMIKNAAATNSLSEDELGILNKYLPEQLTDDKLLLLIKDYIDANDIKSMGDMSKIMTHLKNNYPGLYGSVNAIKMIKQILN